MKRFWSKVKKTKGCWEWQGATIRNGYGAFGSYKGSTQVGAHRVSYELTIGEIPSGMEIDHLCRNRSCVNPDHLEVVTRKENQLRSNSVSGVNARKKECIRGHLITYVRPDGKGRECITCKKLRASGGLV